MKRRWVGAVTLEEAYPDMPVAEEFQSLFDSCAAESERFAVLVIRIDDLKMTLRHFRDSGSTIVLSVATVLDGVRKSHGVTWGRLDQDQFACICPDMEEGDAEKLAREMQDKLARSVGQTVSVGIAIYPFWPFERTTILANAQKALDHAAFLGPGTVTPFDAVSLNISADKLYQYGDIDGAIEEFKKALALDPKNVNVHNSLGVCYGARGELQLAIEAFESVIELNPKDVMATYNLGLAHLGHGDQEKALSLFLEAHGLDGDNPEISYQIGTCYQERDDNDAALGYLEKAAQNTSKGAHVFRALADCYLSKEMPHEAAKAYEKAIRTNPTDAKSLSALGHLYGVLGENMDIAIVLARESTTLEPNNGLFHHRLGKLHLQNSDYEKAAEELKMATELGEDCGELISEVERAMGETP